MSRRESGVGEECCEVKDLKIREKKQGKEEDESDFFYVVGVGGMAFPDD